MSTLVEFATKPWHLIARFFRSLPSTPPSIAEESWADEHLLAGERVLWVQLSNQDRRHSIGVAQRFDDVRSGASRAETAGALLHDVGKIECHLGTFGRVAATLVGPRSERFRLYHDHEEIGARLALDAGSVPETVELIAGRGPAYSDLCTSDF